MKHEGTSVVVLFVCVCVCFYMEHKYFHTRKKAHSRHWFTTSILWRKLPESDARSVGGKVTRVPLSRYNQIVGWEG